MSAPHEELLQIADELDRVVERGHEARVQNPLEQLKQAAEEVGKASSGSWLGYHANVYYKNLELPPPGVHFSQEWGLNGYWPDEPDAGWQEYEEGGVKAAIYRLAADPDLETPKKFTSEVNDDFDRYKSDVLSILETELVDAPDSFLSRLKSDIENLSIMTERKVIRILQPKGKFTTRDYIVRGQNFRVPPHISVLAEALAIQSTIETVQNLSKLTRQAGSHLLRKQRRRQKAETVGTNVFIGHGRSQIWRELKDFVEDRLKLPVDEFNRVPAAGITNIARLSEMLDAAAIAFLIMTGEDEQPDGTVRARMNVVHEAGLFQGRLGFTRAIVLWEEGCEGFSNIEGLGQIRFPKGNIRAAFEEIREVLEREGLLGANEQSN